MTTEQALEITEQISKNIDNSRYIKYGSFLSLNEVEDNFPENTELIMWNENNKQIDKILEGFTEMQIKTH